MPKFTQEKECPKKSNENLIDRRLGQFKLYSAQVLWDSLTLSLCQRKFDYRKCVPNSIWFLLNKRDFLSLLTSFKSVWFRLLQKLEFQKIASPWKLSGPAIFWYLKLIWYLSKMAILPRSQFIISLLFNQTSNCFSGNSYNVSSFQIL